MPRPPVPTRLKILRGNPGRRPLPENEPEPRRDLPRLPRWLRAFPGAVKEWRRKARELHETGILTVLDGEALAMWAYTYIRVQELAEVIRINGSTVPTAEGEKSSPEAVQLDRMLEKNRQYQERLGLDPSGRVKLRTEKPNKPIGRVAAFMGRKNGQAK